MEHTTVEIINLFDGRGGIKVHSSITVVSDQLNTGKAEFDLPKMETFRWVYNSYVVTTAGDLSCMELHYSLTDYSYGFSIFIYL